MYITRARTVSGGGTATRSPAETKDRQGRRRNSTLLIHFFACRLIGLNQSHPTLGVELHGVGRSFSCVVKHFSCIVYGCVPVGVDSRTLDGNVIFCFSPKWIAMGKKIIRFCPCPCARAQNAKSNSRLLSVGRANVIRNGLTKHHNHTN